MLIVGKFESLPIWSATYCEKFGIMLDDASNEIGKGLSTLMLEPVSINKPTKT